MYVCNGKRPLPMLPGMRIEGPVNSIGLDAEASLRIEPGISVCVTCLAGALWITQEGDVRDLLLTPGQSLVMNPRGLTLMTALQRSTVRVRDGRDGAPTAFGWWGRVWRRLGPARPLVVRAGRAAVQCHGKRPTLA
jgi:hypothetical protein